jgi:hypothetical protein
MQVTSSNKRPITVWFSSDMQDIWPVTSTHFSNKKLNAFSSSIPDCTIRCTDDTFTYYNMTKYSKDNQGRESTTAAMR